MRKTSLTASAIILLATAALGQVQRSDSVVTIAAGTKYKAPAFRKLFWGKHYRKEWATPVSFPVLRIDMEKGGLKPLKLGGGHESKTLRVLSADGREYVLKTIDKSLDVIIPGELKGTFLNDLVNDQISSGHPYGPLAVAKLSTSVSIPHTNPVIVFVKDSPALGEYHEEIGNKLCLFEERPSGKGWDHTALTGDADDVINSERLFEKLAANTKNRVDQRQLLSMRLFDMVINDWDRHEDQWVWLEHKNDHSVTYEPFPRDRDAAFSRFDGIALYFLSRPWAIRPLQNINPTVKDVLGENFSARNLDRRLLNEMNKEDWENAVGKLRSDLTDSAIVNAVDAMPAEVNKISGSFLVKRLETRRDGLPDYGMRYYRRLSKYVNVVGSAKDERFDINFPDDDHVSITGLQKDLDTFYHRVFNHAETKEINIYGLEGDDNFSVSGTGKSRFKIRLLGDGGSDIYARQNTVSGKRIRVYDAQPDKQPSAGSFRVNHHDDTLFNYHRTATKYDYYMPLVVPGYNPDDGFYLALGFMYRKQKWGKTPFGWQQSFSVDYAFATNAIGFGYKGLFKQTFGKWDFALAASYKGPKFVLNYYGLGDTTTLPVNKRSFYRTASKELFVSPGIGREWKKTGVEAGLEFQTVEVERTSGKFISSAFSDVDSSVFAKKYFAGVNGRWHFSTVFPARDPKKGFSLHAGFSYLHNLKQSSRNLLNLQSSFSFFLSPASFLTFAHRSGIAGNVGDFEFYQANTLGRSENLRGFWRNRFSGQTAFYQNTELRCEVANLRGYVFRGKLGILGFVDDGRVWVKDETSSTIHVGYGGGIYFVPFNALALTLTYAASTETTMIIFKTGFFF